MVDSLEHVFSVHIKGSLEDVWNEITKVGAVQSAYFKSELVSDLTPGAALAYRTADGANVLIEGEVLEIVPRTRFVHTFRFTDKPDPPTRVTYALRETGDGVEITLTHDRFDTETETYTAVTQGWPAILNGLKALIETGTAVMPTDCPASK